MRIKVIVFIGLYFILNVHKVLCQEGAQGGFSCKNPWKKVYNGCYLLVKNNFLSWQDAQDRCTSEGGNLLAFSNDIELQKVSAKIRLQITNRNLLEWWIGLRYDPDLDKWRWTDGSALNTTLTGWAQGEPNNLKGNEECAVITYQNKLKDIQCKEEKPYVCEITMEEITTASSAPITPTAQTASAVSSTETHSYPRGTTPLPTTQTTPTTIITSPSVPTTRTTSESETVSSKFSTTSSLPGSRSTTETAEKTTQSTKQTTETSETVTRVTTEKGTPSATAGTEPTQSTKTTTDIDVTMTTRSSVTMTTEETPTTEAKSERDMSDFIGCYSVNYETACPPLTTLGVSWPRTVAGTKAKVSCGQGSGIATWRCQATPVVCWKGEPDVKSCTSEAIQDLTNKADEILNSKNNSAATQRFMESLAETLDNEEPSSEQDLFQSAKLMSTVSKANPENEDVAKDIVSTALRCGSSIISSTRGTAHIPSETQNMIASSLLGAMEDITMSMMTVINTPTVARIQQPHMEVELQVVDLDEVTTSGASSVKYEGEANTFKIPVETLKNFTEDGLAKLVFIQYDTISKLLEPTNQREDNKTKRQIISNVTSASIGHSGNQSHPYVPQNITFTFKTGERGNRKDFEQLCSFWNFSSGHTGAWSQRGCELKSCNDTHTTCTCNHLTNFAILMDIHSTKIPSVHAASLIYITYVGCIISIICLFLSLVTFTCLSSVQGERNSIHKNLVFCLFVAEILFLAGVERTENKLACSIIAGFLHFFFLSSFSWMFVEGIHILFMLVQVFDSAKSRLRYYYSIGYGCPAIIVGISAAVYHEGYGTESYCWLTTEKLFIWSFAGPVAFTLLVNLIILIYAMSSVCRHSEYVFTKDKSTYGKMKFYFISPYTLQMQKRLNRHMGWIQGALALEVLLGLTWVFGYFYISEEALPVAYLFTIFNSLQGVFIFVFHCLLNKKVRKEYQRFIDYKPQTSTTHTTSKSANGTAGHGTGSSGLPLTTSKRKSSGFSDANSRKHSGFSDINVGRHGSSSA